MLQNDLCCVDRVPANGWRVEVCYIFNHGSFGPGVIDGEEGFLES